MDSPATPNPDSAKAPPPCGEHIVLQIAFEDLRRRLIESCPQVQRQIDQMAELVRELVKLEREKQGLDDPHGIAELWPNKDKKASTDPDWVGRAKVMGRSYRASAWVKDFRIKLVLLPPKR